MSETSIFPVMNPREDSAVEAESASSYWPNFIIIGAMKAGTTTLYGYLSRHPQIFMSTPKEPQFFSRKFDSVQSRVWYQNLFAEAGPDQLCGEASACYSRAPYFGDVANRIANIIPAARFLYVIRHPAERCYSHYRHLMQEHALEGKPAIPLAQALQELPEILETSLYLKQIEQYLQYFKREQLCILTFDELTRAPQRALVEVQNFLGIPEVDLLAGTDTHANRWGDRMARQKTIALLHALRESSLLAPLFRLVPSGLRRRIRSKLLDPSISSVLMNRQIARHKKEVEPFTAEMRQSLIARFEKPNRELEEFLGRRLPAWSE